MTERSTGPIITDVDATAGTRTPYGDTLRWVIGEAESHGHFSMHHRTAPPGAASFPHAHRRVVEAFYVLGGRFEFEIGGETFEAGAGMYVRAPMGVSHAWEVIGDEPATALVIFAPSVGQGFFDEMDAAVAEGADRERLGQINVRYGLD